MLVKICCMQGETLEGVQTSEENSYISDNSDAS